MPVDVLSLLDEKQVCMSVAPLLLSDQEQERMAADISMGDHLAVPNMGVCLCPICTFRF